MSSEATFPAGFHVLSLASLCVGVGCAAAITIDEIVRPQKMWIMNLVWPLTALFGGVLWLAGYWRWGRARPSTPSGRRPPMPLSTAKAASHCGAGCALGDLLAEPLALAFPGLLVATGFGTLFSDRIFATWTLDFILAFTLGVVIQYLTIAPMKHLSLGAGLWRALKADTLSISSWQLGMYGAMGLVQLVWFPAQFGGRARADQAEFWFAMQLAMLCGFLTAYPVNWLLLRAGVKEPM